MSELKGACIIGQSGGPTSVINASAYGVIRTALDSGCITNVYGAEHGIKGVLADRLFDMSKEDARELELLVPAAVRYDWLGVLQASCYPFLVSLTLHSRRRGKNAS